MKRTIDEIKRAIASNIEAMNALESNDTEALERFINADKALQVELKAVEIAEANEKRQAELKADLNKEAKKGNNFSYVRFINGILDGNLNGLEAEVAETGAEEYRRLGLTIHGKVLPSAIVRSAAGQNAGTAADGGYFKETTLKYIDDVNEKLVVNAMGASILRDLVGTIDLASMGNVTAQFIDEAENEDSLKGTVARVQLSPRGIRAKMATTRDLLKQTSVDVERILMDRLMSAAAACIDKTALAAVVSAASSAGTTLTWANAVAMETAINAVNANRGEMGYVLSASAWGAAKTTLKSSGVSGYILDGNDFINGYKADYSNNFAAGVVAAFGNWRDLYIGEWGGADILVDPFTLSKSGEIAIHIFQYADAKVAFAKSFSKLAASGSGSGSGA